MGTAVIEDERGAAVLDLPAPSTLDDLPPAVARLIRRDGLAEVDIADPVALAQITRALRRAPGTPA